MPFPGLQKLIADIGQFDFETELVNIVANHLDELPKPVRKQLSEGLDGDGELVKIFDSDTYSPKTIAIKRREGSGLGAVTDRITNYMSGLFYTSIKFNLEGKVFSADSDVPYFGDIRLRSSPSLLEVSKENRLVFANNITLPEIKAALLEKTGLVITKI